MGYSSFSSHDWNDYSSTTRSTAASKGYSAVFKSTGMPADMNPKDITFRESCDSADHPNSTPIILGLDVTGSMGMIPKDLVTNSLGTFFIETLNRKPVSDPQLLLAGIGDVNYDSAPLQLGQFESGNEVTNWLEKIYLEGGGGGNGTESYEMLYYFAAYYTKCDAFNKRGDKGYVFSIGDELPVTTVSAHGVEKIFGIRPESDISFKDLISRVKQAWLPYHLLIKEGAARYNIDHHTKAWREVMGENVVIVDDYKKIPEIITSILQLNNGVSVKDIVDSWTGSTATSVSTALASISPTKSIATKSAVVRF